MQLVGEPDEATEPVVPVDQRGRGARPARLGEQPAEGVDPPGHVGVRDVRQPEVAPRTPVVDGVRGDRHQAPGGVAHRDVVQHPLGQLRRTEGEAHGIRSARVGRRRPDDDVDDGPVTADRREHEVPAERRAHEVGQGGHRPAVTGRLDLDRAERRGGRVAGDDAGAPDRRQVEPGGEPHPGRLHHHPTVVHGRRSPSGRIGAGELLSQHVLGHDALPSDERSRPARRG